MEFRTLFRAYRQAEEEKQMAIERRGTRLGIAVDNCENSKIYQRYDRLTRRIIMRFEGVKICSLCTAPKGDHFSTCLRKETNNE